MHKLIKLFSDLLFVAGLLVAGIILVGKFTGFTPFRVFIVSSGSMEPNIKTGSVVITIPQKEYKIADIVTFKSGTDKKATTTHRIVGIGGGVFRSAGDANNQPDPALVDTSKIVGKVILSVPYLGYLGGFAQTPRGFILLVIVPATIIIYEELKSLVLEIKKIKPKKNLPSPESGEGSGVRLNNTEWLKRVRPAIIIPVFCAAFILSMSFSLAYFSDTETSSSNSFTAWVPIATPTPIPHIVINEVFPSGNNKAEWIELFNPSSSPVNINNWKIGDANTHNTGHDDSLSAPTDIPAGGYAIIITNQSAAPTPPPPPVITITLTSANIGNGLNVDGDSVFLSNATNTVVDSMSYGSIANPVFPTPKPTPTLGNSLVRQPNGVDTDSAADWQTNVTPSMGTSN